MQRQRAHHRLAAGRRGIVVPVINLQIKFPVIGLKILVPPILRANIDRKGRLERDGPMTTFLPTSVQCTLVVAAFACKVCAWRVTKTLTEPSREMAVIAKTGCVRDLSERLTCAKGRLAL